MPRSAAKRPTRPRPAQPPAEQRLATALAHLAKAPDDLGALQAVMAALPPPRPGKSAPRGA